MHVTYFKSQTRIIDRELLKFALQSAIRGKSGKMTLTLPSTLNKSLNDLLTAEPFAFDTARISRMTTEFFDRPIFVTDDKQITKN